MLTCMMCLVTLVKTKMLEVNNRVIAISGATRGIGNAIANSLIKQGYRLSLGCRNVQETMNRFSGISESQLFIHHYDARKKATAKDWIEATLDKFGQLDGLVNNAGVLKVVGFSAMHDKRNRN